MIYDQPITNPTSCRVLTLPSEGILNETWNVFYFNELHLKRLYDLWFKQKMTSHESFMVYITATANMLGEDRIVMPFKAI